MTRMAIIKLIAKVIEAVADAKGQARLYLQVKGPFVRASLSLTLLQLAESENPFEGVRVQSITMLRDAISKVSPASLSLHTLLK